MKPLRSVRRHVNGMPEGEIRVLRTKVKGLELEAERIEQTILFSLAEIRWSTQGKASQTVALVSTLDVLLRALGCAESIGEDGAVQNLIAAVLALDAFVVRA